MKEVGNNLERIYYSTETSSRADKYINQPYSVVWYEFYSLGTMGEMWMPFMASSL